MPDNTTQDEIEKQLTNNYMPRLLAYVEKDEGFTQLIRGIEAYISYAGGVLGYSIDSHNQPAQSIDTDTDIAYLQRLVGLLGISLDYFPSDYFISGDENLDTLRELYLLAIRGAVINRTGDATKAKLLSALQAMYRDAEITIVDGGMPNLTAEQSPGKMSIAVYIQGITTNMDSAVLTLYLKQNITGVYEQFNFDVVGVAVFDPVDTTKISEGDSVDGIEEIITPEELQVFFENTNQPTRPYGYKEATGNDNSRIYGMGAYLWCRIAQNGEGENNFIEDPIVAPTSTSPDFGNPPTYNATAMWMIQLI